MICPPVVMYCENVALSGPALKILAAGLNRKRIIVKKEGAGTIRVAQMNTVTSTDNGYLLGDGEVLEVFHSGEFWAAGTGIISIISEAYEL